MLQRPVVSIRQCLHRLSPSRRTHVGSKSSQDSDQIVVLPAIDGLVSPGKARCQSCLARDDPEQSEAAGFQRSHSWVRLARGVAHSRTLCTAVDLGLAFQPRSNTPGFWHSLAEVVGWTVPTEVACSGGDCLATFWPLRALRSSIGDFGGTGVSAGIVGVH